jgi:hypothetical protein
VVYFGVDPGDTVYSEAFRVVPDRDVYASLVGTVAVQAPKAPRGRPSSLKVVEHVGVLNLADSNGVWDLAARGRGQAAAHRIQFGIIAQRIPSVHALRQKIPVSLARIRQGVKQVLNVPPNKKQGILFARPKKGVHSPLRGSAKYPLRDAIGTNVLPPLRGSVRPPLRGKDSS